jgi:hypothetical protein
MPTQTITNADGSTTQVSSTFNLGELSWQTTIVKRNPIGQLLSELDLLKDGTTIAIDYNLAGGPLVSTVSRYDPTGKLVRVDEVFPLGKSISFDTGTYNNLSYNPATGGISANMTTASGTPLGALTWNADGSGTLTLPDNVTINLSTGSGPYIAGVAASTSSIDTLVAYLTDLNYPTSVLGLDQLRFDAMHAKGTPHDLTGTVVKVDDSHARVYYYADTPEANIAGQGTATITDYVNGTDSNGNPIQIPTQVQAQATNILVVPTFATTDISRDDISNIQILQGGTDGTVYMAA